MTLFPGAIILSSSLQHGNKISAVTPFKLLMNWRSDSKRMWLQENKMGWGYEEARRKKLFKYLNKEGRERKKIGKTFFFHEQQIKVCIFIVEFIWTSFQVFEQSFIRAWSMCDQVAKEPGTKWGVQKTRMCGDRATWWPARLLN